ncbi:MAG: hypothetical protein J5I93_09395 [Pirellulaceae bacterium]|nr:hypothetical protein [Pirellulaceae bacterium]
MDETRESCLAAILARGLIRVRQRAERTGTWTLQGDDQPQPTAADASTGDHPPADQLATGSEQGEQQ